jgi:hypothetical protein
MDSNFRFRASGDTPHRPRGEAAASHRSRLPLRRDPASGRDLDDGTVSQLLEGLAGEMNRPSDRKGAYRGMVTGPGGEIKVGRPGSNCLRGGRLPSARRPSTRRPALAIVQPLNRVIQIKPPAQKILVRPVSVNGNGSARAAAAAAVMRSVAWLSSKIGAPGLPLASSIEQPTSPAFAASLIVSATISGASPKQTRRSSARGRQRRTRARPSSEPSRRPLHWR